MPDRPAPPPARGGHYFDPSPSATSRTRSVRLSLPDLTIELTTDRGVFSHDRVDPGTKLLLLDGPRPPAGPCTLADVGCGYGPIAVTLARRAPEATIWAVDVNSRARELCAANAEAAGVGDRVRVVAPEEVPADLRLDGIWSNPPIRIGKPALHALLTEWLDRLSPTAAAALVVQKHLGADSLARWLGGQGRPVDRVGVGGGYRLLVVRRRAAGAAGEDPPVEGAL